MVTYNHEKYIAQAMEGILAQETDFTFELIVSNDASTDNTDFLIKTVIRDHPKRKMIKYFNHKKNLGMIDNFKFAYKECHGKYVAMCDGDDYWTEPFKLQQQIDFLEENPDYSGAFHETGVLNELLENNNTVPKRVHGTANAEDVTAEDTISQWALFHTSSFVFRKDAFIVPDWFHKVDSPDMGMFSIVAASGPLRKIPGVMSVYRKHEGGITETAALKNNFYENRILLTNYLNEFHQCRYAEKANSIIALHQQAIDDALALKKRNSPVNLVKARVKNRIRNLLKK